MHDAVTSQPSRRGYLTRLDKADCTMATQQRPMSLTTAHVVAQKLGEIVRSSTSAKQKSTVKATKRSHGGEKDSSTPSKKPRSGCRDHCRQAVYVLT